MRIKLKVNPLRPKKPQELKVGRWSIWYASVADFNENRWTLYRSDLLFHTASKLFKELSILDTKNVLKLKQQK